MRHTLQVLCCLIFSIISIENAYSQDLTPSQQPHLKGYWKFQNPNNLTKATVGNNLTLVGSHQWVAGPERKDTAVRIGIGSYYRCAHGIAPNGGGDSVNRYTLMFDFRIDNLNRWHTFFQTDTTNQNDGECFIRPNTGSNPGRIGTATTGYTPISINTNQWYRLVISVNLGNYYRYYLNGQLILDGNNQDIDDRFSLNPQVLFFADNDQEDDTIDIASVAIFDTCLSNSEVANLGTVDPCILYPMSLKLGNDTFVCGNNTLVKNLVKGYTYKWSTNDTGANVSFSASKLGLGQKTISVEMRDIYNCVKRDTMLVSFYNNPSPNAGKDTAFCSGPSYRITAGSAAGNSYEWKHFPSGNIVSKINAMTTDSSGTYVVKMTNSNLCFAYDTVVVQVNPTPFKPSIFYNSLQLCNDDTFKFYGSGNYAQYLWSDGKTSKSNFRTNPGSLSLRVKTNFGCISPVSDSVIFTFFSKPTTPIILYSKDTIICDGDSVLLFVQGNYNSVNWSDGYKGQSRFIKQNNTLSLRITDNNNCKSDISASIRVYKFPRPNKPIITVAGGLQYCQGDSAILNCTTNGDNIFWSNGLNLDRIKVTSSQSISVYSTSNFGCSSDMSDTVDIRFYEIPSIPKIEVYYPDSLRSSLEAIKYQWTKNKSIMTDSTRSIPFSNCNTFGLRIRNEFCWSSFTDSFICYTDIINTIHYHSFLVSPNPVTNYLNIDNLIDYNISEYSIYSSDGKIVISNNKIDKNLDVSMLSAGVYYIIMNGQNTFYRSSFIKE